MKQKRIVVLGCGWLGTAIAKSLKSAGFSLIGSTTTSSRFKDLSEMGIEPVLIDLGNHPENLRDVLTGARWIILSTPPGPLASAGTALTSVLATMEDCKIIMISSTSVYPGSREPVQEEDAIHRTSPHSGVDLLSLEDSIRSVIPAIVLRLGGLYGPGRHPGGFLAGKNGLSNGNAPVNLIHQEDVVCIVSEIIARDISPDIFNAVAPQHPARETFYRKAALSAGVTPPEFSGEENPDGYKLVDSSRLMDVLGYTFRHPDPLEDI